MTVLCQGENAVMDELMPQKRKSRFRNEGFGRRLRQAIEAKYGEQPQYIFADALQIAHSRLSQYVKGQVPDWHLLLRMIDYLGVTLDYLLRGQNESVLDGLDSEEQLALRRCRKILGSEDDELRGLLVTQAKALEETLEGRRIKRGSGLSPTSGDPSPA